MNKSNGNMYEWITHTWNPLIGKCLHGCTYCSTNKFRYPKLQERYSGDLRLDEKALKEDLGKGNFIFVCAQNDLFAWEVPIYWIEKIINYCSEFDNAYLFQSKNTFLLSEYSKSNRLPKKSIVCATIETNRRYPEIMKNSPDPKDRVFYMPLKQYITIEPIMDFDLKTFVDFLKSCEPIHVNIGADSGNNHLPEPSKDKILALISELKKFTIVKEKSNLKRLLNEKEILTKNEKI